MSRATRGAGERFSIYKLLRGIHLWLTLIFAVPVFVLSITGAILVFGEELQSLISPDTHKVAPGGERLSQTELLAEIRRQKSEMGVWSVSIKSEPDEAWSMWLRDGAGVLNVDPYTGRVLDHYYPVETFRGWVTGLHRRFLAEGESARWVRHGVSAITLVLLVQVLLGLWIWAIPRNRLQRLKVGGGMQARLLVLRLHNLTGVVAALLLVLILFTGMSIYWHAPTRAVVEGLTGSEVTEPLRPDTQGLAPVADLDAALAVGRAAVPDGTLKFYRPPGRPGAPVIMNFERPGTVFHTKAWVGDAPPRVIAVDESQGATAAGAFWHIRYQIHMGTFGGWPIKMLWVVLALMPPAFIGTGLWLYWQRRKDARAGKAAAPSSAGAAASPRA
ncbi:MAG: PepSY-associated TM helix domain-containing protein [Acetobacterales bacterium]